jgi:hypothetical protein
LPILADKDSSDDEDFSDTVLWWPTTLSGSDSWEEWFLRARGHATDWKIWDYVNPSLPEDLLSKLEEPKKPLYGEAVLILDSSGSSATADSGPSPTAREPPQELRDLTAEERLLYMDYCKALWKLCIFIRTPDAAHLDVWAGG